MQSCRAAYLWVFEDNERARRFYERQGWRADTVTKQDRVGGTQIVERRYSITF
jgi:RimJ/RimL family protein N-acetyltransferase